MPKLRNALNKDPKGKDGGLNTDGTPSNMYCSYCYEDGRFLQPNITAEEMGGFMKLFAGVFSKGIPKLERWKNK